MENRFVAPFRRCQALSARQRIAVLALAHGLLAAAHAETIRVSVQGPVRTIAEAARIAKDGDTVLIAAGEYRGDVAVWHQRKLRIRGEEPRPVLIADGKSAEDKATWVIRNGEFEIGNIEFRGSRVPDGNGAGIRFEDGSLVLDNCVFADNQMGLLTGNSSSARLSIKDSVFEAAPHQEHTLPHLLYAGTIASLSVTGSRFHSGYRGHLIKSRAQKTELKYNMIVDGPSGSASYEVDLPNGGDAVLVGNVIGQSSRTKNRVLIAYGAEGPRWNHNRLVLSHNTIASDGLLPAWFLRVWTGRFPRIPQVDTYNNLIVGFGIFALGVPGIHLGNRLVSPRVVSDPEHLDFRMARSARVTHRAESLTEALSDLTPTREFNLPVGVVPIQVGHERVVGAFQSERREPNSNPAPAASR